MHYYAKQLPMGAKLRVSAVTDCGRRQQPVSKMSLRKRQGCKPNRSGTSLASVPHVSARGMCSPAHVSYEMPGKAHAVVKIFTGRIYLGR